MIETPAQILPPFLAGKEAYLAGLPCNPPDLPHDDCYPGARQNWIDGWNVERGLALHSEQIRAKARALDLMSDGRERTKGEIMAHAGELTGRHWQLLKRAFTARRVSTGKVTDAWLYSMRQA